MNAEEVFAIIGLPARYAGRLPLLLRYIWGAQANLLAPSGYAFERWGPSYRWKPWLVIDAVELDAIERLINGGTDEDVTNFRSAQLANGAGIAVVGSLLASACATMLTLQSLSDINILVRGIFTISLVLSMLSVYFTLVQQRELSVPTNAHMIRVWLWNGRWRAPPSHHVSSTPIENPGAAIRESSLTSHYIISAPFEILRIAVAMFLCAVTTYLALVMAQDINLGTGPTWGNRGLLIAFVICTTFALMVFGQSLGQKDRETMKCRAAEREQSNLKNFQVVVSSPKGRER